MTLKSDTKFEEKLALVFKKDMRNLVNFNASCGSSENFHFDRLTRKYVMFELKNIVGLCREKLLMVSKMTSIIWQNFTQKVESIVG